MVCTDLKSSDFSLLHFTLLHWRQFESILVILVVFPIQTYKKTADPVNKAYGLFS